MEIPEYGFYIIYAGAGLIGLYLLPILIMRSVHLALEGYLKRLPLVSQDVFSSKSGQKADEANVKLTIKNPEAASSAEAQGGEQQEPSAEEKKNGADEEFDVVIVGAGIAGSVLGIILAREQKRKVCVIERGPWDENPKNCFGEGMAYIGQEILRKHNLLHLLQDNTHGELAHVTAKYKNREMYIPFPVAEETGKVHFKTVRRHEHLDRLRATLKSTPGVTVKDGAVQKVTESNGRVTGVVYKPKGTADECTVLAPLTIVAAGRKALNLRGKLMPKSSHFRTGYYCAFGAKTNPQVQQFEGEYTKAEFHFVDFGHTLMYPVNDHQSLRMLAEYLGKSPPKDPLKWMHEEVIPTMPPGLQEAFKDAEYINTHANEILVSKAPEETAGVALVGDFLDSRHAATGSGQTTALVGVEVLTRLLSGITDLSDRSTVDEAVTQYYTERKPLTTVFSIFGTLFQLSIRKSSPELAEAIFDYFDASKKTKQWRSAVAGAMFVGSCQNQRALSCLLVSALLMNLSTRLAKLQLGGAYRLLRDGSTNANKLYQAFSTDDKAKKLFNFMYRVFGRKEEE